MKRKTAVVTGGRRGIGRAWALALMGAGYKVMVIAKSEGRGDLPDGIDYMSVDFTKRCAFAECDVLVNAAGVAYSDPVGEPAHISETWAVNYLAPVAISTELVKRGCKRIVNITSVSAFNGARNNSEYCATKAALTAWTKCASNEWAPLVCTI